MGRRSLRRDQPPSSSSLRPSATDGTWQSGGRRALPRCGATSRASSQRTSDRVAARRAFDATGSYDELLLQFALGTIAIGVFVLTLPSYDPQEAAGSFNAWQAAALSHGIRTPHLCRTREKHGVDLPLPML